MYTQFRLETMNVTDHLGDIGLDGSITLKWIFKKERERLHGFIYYLN